MPAHAGPVRRSAHRLGKPLARRPRPVQRRSSRRLAPRAVLVSSTGDGHGRSSTRESAQPAV